MTLTTHQVIHLYDDSLFETHSIEEGVLVEGIMTNAKFDPARLAEQTPGIREALAQLPDSFRQPEGGSFAEASSDINGVKWADDRVAELLILLGMAIGDVTCLHTREEWQARPDGMPHYVVASPAEGTPA